MKKNYVFIFTLSLLFGITTIKAQTVWTGPITTFTKPNNADWTLELNQDRITDNVWITRANTQGIFNIATETGYTSSSSPSDTEWAIGTTDSLETLTFNNWQDTSGSNPQSLVNQDMVIHLITDNIYIDIKFISYSGGGPGGGFSYERSTDQSLSITHFEKKLAIKLFPNPSNNYIEISGLTKKEDYTIYNTIGSKIKIGDISNNNKIDIKNLSDGLYFLKFDNENILRFIKK